MLHRNDARTTRLLDRPIEGFIISHAEPNGNLRKETFNKKDRRSVLYGGERR